MDDEPQAWLYGKSADDRLVVRQGTALDLDDFHAVVRDIFADHLLLEHDGAVWRLNLGENLRSMQKLEQTSTFSIDRTNGSQQETPVEAPEPHADD